MIDYLVAQTGGSTPPGEVIVIPVALAAGVAGAAIKHFWPAGGNTPAKTGSNGNGNGPKYNRDFCDERHRHIDEAISRIEQRQNDGFNKIMEKLNEME